MRRRDARFHAVVDHAYNLICTLEGGRVTFINKAGLGLIGATHAAAVQGTQFASMFHPDYREIIDGGIGEIAEDDSTFLAKLMRADGVAVDVEMTVTPLTAANGPAAAYMIEARDITARNRAAEALRNYNRRLRAQADDLRKAKNDAELTNRAKSQFLANTSHELRTPLNAIIGFSDMIREEMFGPLGNEKYAEYINDIHESGAHLLHIINDVLDVSMIETGQLALAEKRLDIADIIETSARLVRVHVEAAGLEFRIDCAEGLPDLNGDGRRVKQVVVNLLTNAINFTPQGGRVSLTAAMNDDGGLEISVADTGIGMVSSEIEAAFQPFDQADNSDTRTQGGLGLGLPLAKSLMELHDGSIDIRSAKGAGTTVVIRFPAARLIS